MVISFEEKDRAVIEAQGITIIEFKRFLYKSIKPTIKVLDSLMEYVQLIIKAWNKFKKWFFEAIDNVKLIVGQIRDYTCCPVSFRYKIIRFISKCTRIDMHKLWNMTRRTWLARSRI